MIDGRQNPPISIAELIPERILWPEFLELDGMIFLRDGFDRRLYESYLYSFKGQEHALPLEQRLESLLNQRYLKEIFLGTGYVPDRRALEQLGQLLEHNWQTKLNMEFPGRNMKARFAKEFDNTGFAGWWISACRKGPESSTHP